MKADDTVACGRTFLVTDREGHCSRPHDGLYHEDVRHLRRYAVVPPRPVETLDVAHPRPGVRVVHAGSELVDAARALQVTRRQVVTDALVERVEIQNLEREPTTETVDVELSAGFEDVFEVRGYESGLDRDVRVESVESGVRFSYDPADVDYDRSTTVRLRGADEFDRRVGADGTATLSTTLAVDPGGAASFVVAAAPTDSATVSFERAAERLREREREWRRSGSLPSTPRPAAAAVLERSRRDLLSLTMATDHGPVFTAGTPWYATVFGRDSLLAAYLALPFSTAPAEATVRFLAAHQATAVDEFRAAAPGKILHELRCGELAVRGIVPHSPYYGTVDATPLFVVLLHETWRRTGDDGLLADLEPALAAALEWFETASDADGFLTYPTADGELIHQGWKDSDDGVVHPDGRRPTGPLAVAEAQGYQYDALVRAADVYRHRGEEGRASDLEARAAALAARFDERFWMPAESCYAVALDGDGNRVESVTSNPGHCLWSGIVPRNRADDLVDRLLADDLFTGWGLRTLSADHDAYNPQSYHRGSVWPHDTSLAVLGMVNYGRPDAAREVTDALLAAATRRGGHRLPELFAGFDREHASIPVSYGDACEPQAWAAAAPVACLGALEGEYDLAVVNG